MKKYILIIITSLSGLTHAMADDISIPNLNVEPGTTATVDISLNNTETNLVSFQMDLTLPDGITINKAGCSLSNRFTDEDQELTIGKQGANVYRLTSTSFSLTPISGTSGEIITLSLMASNDFEGGTATLGNIRFVTSQSEKILISDASFIISVATPSPTITFADANVKALCVANWDANEDGELSEEEAAAVTNLGGMFTGNPVITSFNELQYFTGLTEIGNNAFEGCASLASVIIPENVTRIGSRAFLYCWGLKSIDIPNGVQAIDDTSFHETGLVSIIIPESVNSIGIRAFTGCPYLESIVVDSNNQYYDSRDNCNAIIETTSNSLVCGCKNSFIPEGVLTLKYGAFEQLGDSLMSISIPESVHFIEDCAFSATGLTSLTLPNNVEVIANWAFNGCSKLKSIRLPRNLTTINERAFYASALESIEIPETVTSIYNEAFVCDNLTMVIVKTEVPIVIPEDAFSNRANATLYVPVGCKAAYEAAEYWNEFKEIIEDIELIPGDVNSDNAVDVSDYLTIANYILGQAPTTFNEAAADVTQDDNVDVTDYLGVANIILYGNYQGPQANNANAIKALTTEQASPWMGMEVTEDGLVELLLHNTPTFSAFQIDIFLPEGIEIYEANMSKANQTRNLSYAQLQNGAWRLLYGTMDGKTVNLADHSLLTLKLTSKNKEAFGDIDVEGITLVRPNTSVMHLSGVHGTLPTGISDIESMMPAEANCYDLTGRKVTESHLKKGVYIINGKKFLLSK